MKSAAPRKLLSLVMLALYGGIALLGEGLHGLHPDGHHHGHDVVRCLVHGDDCPHFGHAAGHHHDGDACEEEHETGLVLTANDCATESHACEICKFLAQLRVDRVLLAATVDWQPLVVAVAVMPRLIYSPTPVGPHAPRGPPILAGVSA